MKAGFSITIKYYSIIGMGAENKTLFVLLRSADGLDSLHQTNHGKASVLENSAHSHVHLLQYGGNKGLQ